jgi:uncharacterized GH25 family protein
LRFQALKAIPDVVSATPSLQHLQNNLEGSVLDNGKGVQQREITAALLNNADNMNVNQSL